MKLYYAGIFFLLKYNSNKYKYAANFKWNSVYFNIEFYIQYIKTSIFLETIFQITFETFKILRINHLNLYNWISPIK